MRLIVFDFDGTLVDSQRIIMAAMKLAFGRHGVPAPEEDIIRMIVGRSVFEAMSELAPDLAETDWRALADCYREAFFELRQDPDNLEPFFDGAREAIETLSRTEGVLLGIATGKTKRGLHAFLDHVGLTDRFATLQTSDEVPSKPHPQMLLQALAQAKVDADQAVMVGDTSFDLDMARNAGVAAIGVTWGFHPVERLKASSPFRILDHFNELRPALSTLWPGFPP